MKKVTGILILLTVMALATPAMFGQEERGQVSVFADYVRLRHAGNANFWGPGGSLAFNLNNYAALEGSMAYDLEKTVVVSGTDPLTGATFTTNNGLRLWHGEFGPKFQTGFHSAKLYLVLKGGFLHFSSSQNFANTVGQFGNGDTNGVFYPGVGFEVGKRFGLRAEVGDLMYFDNGVNHNLRIQVGPKISF